MTSDKLKTSYFNLSFVTHHLSLPFMSARLTVIFYIILCLEAGIVLTFLPWMHPFGLSDWGDNFFLLYTAQKTGFYALQQTIASGWVRGAVTGLGLINFALAFWEIINFRRTVRALDGHTAAGAAVAAPAAPPSTHAARPDHADHLSDH
ncbi:MAG: hypothetical protein QOG00_3380 [Pyrinomonadaceae bacterium]|nr:hypothetical protein [Pyrinomonadaceae bacterium]